MPYTAYYNHLALSVCGLYVGDLAGRSSDGTTPVLDPGEEWD